MATISFFRILSRLAHNACEIEYQCPDGQEKLDMKDDLWHNQNCTGLLALKNLKDIKEHLKAWGKVICMEEHQINIDSHKGACGYFSGCLLQAKDRLAWSNK